MQLLHRTKHMSHEARILQALKKAGHYGMYNHELSKQSIGGIAWHRRITDLRKEGYIIDHVQISKTTHKYYLNQS